MIKIKNTFSLILIIIFAICSIGNIYFFGYNQAQINSPLANFFLYSGVVVFIIAVINGRDNVKKQLQEAYSPANSRQTIKILIYLVIGTSIINFISKFIGGSMGYTTGLILGMLLVGGLFLFIRNKK